MPRTAGRACCRLQVAMMAALELDQPLELEIDLPRLDGERRRVECVSGVIRDETGAVQRLIGAVHDVNDTIGHATGDQLLQKVSGRLKAT